MNILGVLDVPDEGEYYLNDIEERSVLFMRQRDNQTTVARLDEKRMLSVQELCMYVGLGRNNAVEFGKSIHAERRIGKRCLYDRAAIDRHFDNQMQDA